MALTPDDVVKKQFRTTQFKKGYDEDEVDDFLDEVVAELRRLSSENDELRQKLSSCEARVGQLSRSTAAKDADTSTDTPTGEQPRPLSPAGTSSSASSEDKTSSQDEASSSDEASAQAQPTPRQPTLGEDIAAPSGEGPEAVTGMLALAQRLHDEYVRSGEEQRDRIVSEAQEHATRLVSDAEEKQSETLGSLEHERGQLQRKIGELRDFEREYRSRLKSYLQGQLSELETTGTVVPGPGGHGTAEGESTSEVEAPPSSQD